MGAVRFPHPSVDSAMGLMPLHPLPGGPFIPCPSSFWILQPNGGFPRSRSDEAFNCLAESLGSSSRATVEELGQNLTSARGRPKKLTDALQQLAYEKGDLDFDGHRKEFARLLARMVAKRVEDVIAKGKEYKPTTPMEGYLLEVRQLACELRAGYRFKEELEDLDRAEG